MSILRFATYALIFSFFTTILLRPAYAQETEAVITNWTIPNDEDIEALLEERMRDNGIGIVVGVIDADGQRVIVHGETGALDDRPLDGDSIFQIGSVTKPFTTLLLADMVVRNEVSLDDFVQEYIPSTIGLGGVTLRHLAMHTSGLPSMPDNLDLQADPNPVDGYTVSDLYEFLNSVQPATVPGTVRRYSNVGVSLLGRILGTHRGISYEELLIMQVLQPLGMHDTAITLNDSQLWRVLPGHDRYLQPVETWEMRAMPASGSLRSSVNDLLKFVETYLNPQSSPFSAAIELQLGNRTEFNDGDQALWTVLPGEIIQHSGGKSGYRSGIAINLSAGLGAVVLSNARTDDLPIDMALHLVSGLPLNPAPQAPENQPRVSLSSESLNAYSGTYRFESGNEYEVGYAENMLLVRYPSGAILEFAPTSDREFYYIAGNDEIEFVSDSGSDPQLILFPNGREDGLQFEAVRL